VSDPTAAYKQAAAEAAVTHVESGMALGLGHGSTVEFALTALADKIKTGALKDLVGVPCSKKTESDALRLGIPLADLNNFDHLDLTIDGADEVDSHLNLIKGGGGALLREKIVAQASRREIIIIDENKLSEKLGTRHLLPVEVLPFAWQRQRDFIASLGAEVRLREDANGRPTLSDQGNYLLDCDFGPIADVYSLAAQLASRPGVIEHGLFLGLATDVIVAGTGGIRHLKRQP
jgi:ribose 5-phosphate isomerase A